MHSGMNSTSDDEDENYQNKSDPMRKVSFKEDKSSQGFGMKLNKEPKPNSGSGFGGNFAKGKQ
jgi:hypothetical protein